MIKHYADYFWKAGKPYGKGIVDPEEALSYKIVSDPYHKWISIEKYRGGIFDIVVYDSHFLDFRHLSLGEQVGWQRKIVQDKGEETISILRDQNDRAVLIETCFFSDNLCKKCIVTSIHGMQLCMHQMFYTHLGDEYNGITLYDSEERPIMSKTYEIDRATFAFTQLIHETWAVEPKAS